MAVAAGPGQYIVSSWNTNYYKFVVVLSSDGTLSWLVRCILSGAFTPATDQRDVQATFAGGGASATAWHHVVVQGSIDA